MLIVILQPDARSTFVFIVLLTVIDSGTVGMAVSATTAATVGGGNATHRVQVDCIVILLISGFAPHDDHNSEGNFKSFHDVFHRCPTRKRKAADQHDGTVMKGPLDGECVDSSESETSSCTHDLYRRRCNRSRSRASVGVVLRVCLFSYVVLFHCA